MQVLMFSGNSLRNKAWIYEAKAKFADLFDELYVQDYRHWETGEQWIDLGHELEVLRARHFDGDYGVFAKSIGTVLAVQAAKQGIIKPKFLFLCGIPLDFIEKDYPQFAKDLASLDVPTTVVHNEHDKVGSAAAARAYLEPAFTEPHDFTFIQTPGDTHDYEDYELLRNELTRLRG